MNERLINLIDAHKEDWLDRAVEKCGLDREGLALIHDGMVAQLFASSQSWPVIDPFNNALRGLTFRVAKFEEVAKQLQATKPELHLDLVSKLDALDTDIVDERLK